MSVASSSSFNSKRKVSPYPFSSYSSAPFINTHRLIA